MIKAAFTLLSIVAVCLAHKHHTKGHCHKDNENPIVTTPLGKIQGSILTSRLDKSIYSFRGIRYAEPPVDDLRFKPPVPVKKYEGVYNATADAPMCPQFIDDPVSEDCLFLNVYTTKLPESGNQVKRPVIVHIHSGGFYSIGAPSYWAGPQYFLDQDIVLVTFQYRLATLGFLATGDKESPGNNGLKDQVAVLRWVQQNIASFGGDPDSVTLTGYSAGGISVSLHMVSPMSKGLFHKAIAMSDDTTAQWPIPTQQLDVAKKQANLLGCPSDTSANIIKCLKTKHYNELGNSLLKFAEFPDYLLLVWTPVIEPDFGQERFLTDHPIKLFENGQFHNVPFITGVTTEEFSYLALRVLGNQSYIDEINNNWETVAPITFLYERDTEKSKKVSKGLRSFYLKDKPVDSSQAVNLGQLYADSTVGFGVNRAAKIISNKSSENVYYYKFSFQGRYSHFYLPGTNDTKTYGVVHHDDLIYLFYIQKRFPFFQKDDPEVVMVNKLTTLHANFAKYGDPIPTPSDELDNVKWEPYNIKTQKYLDIGDKLTMKERLFEDRYAEWEKLYPIEEYL